MGNCISTAVIATNVVNSSRFMWRFASNEAVIGGCSSLGWNEECENGYKCINGDCIPIPDIDESKPFQVSRQLLSSLSDNMYTEISDEGIGVFRFEDISVQYMGGLKKDNGYKLRNGKGITMYEDGSFYVGDCSNDEFNGFGVQYLMPDDPDKGANILIGKWKKNLVNGAIISKEDNKIVVQIGEWSSSGDIISAYPVQTFDGTVEPKELILRADGEPPIMIVWRNRDPMLQFWDNPYLWMYVGELDENNQRHGHLGVTVHYSLDLKNTAVYEADFKHGVMYGMGKLYKPGTVELIMDTNHGMRFKPLPILGMDANSLQEMYENYIKYFVPISMENGQYIGQRNDVNEPDGFGQMKYDDDLLYVGDWTVGKKNGEGMLRNYGNGEFYYGQYKDGMMTGLGVFRWADGNQYIGEWINNEQHGKGMVVWVNGDFYFGMFEHGKAVNDGVRVAQSKESIPAGSNSHYIVRVVHGQEVISIHKKSNADKIVFVIGTEIEQQLAIEKPHQFIECDNIADNHKPIKCMHRSMSNGQNEYQAQMLPMEVRNGEYTMYLTEEVGILRVYNGKLVYGKYDGLWIEITLGNVPHIVEAHFDSNNLLVGVGLMYKANTVIQIEADEETGDISYSPIYASYYQTQQDIYENYKKYIERAQ